LFRSDRAVAPPRSPTSHLFGVERGGCFKSCASARRPHRFSPDGSKSVHRHSPGLRHLEALPRRVWSLTHCDYTEEKNTSGRVPKYLSGRICVHMWHANHLFSSAIGDGDESLQLRYRLQTNHQLHRYTESDVKGPSLGPDAIVTKTAVALRSKCWQSGKSALPMSSAQPKIWKRGRVQRAVARNIAASRCRPPPPEPQSKRRKHFHLPIEHGRHSDLSTRPSNAFRTQSAWSPDGKSLRSSDKDGAVLRCTRAADGRQATRH